MELPKGKCPYCGARICVNALNRHIDTCSMMPEWETLRALVEQGYTVTEISESCGVSTHFVQSWLRRAGLKTASVKGRRRSKKARISSKKIGKIILPRLFFPRSGCSEKCAAFVFCRQLVKQGLVLCEPLDKNQHGRLVGFCQQNPDLTDFFVQRGISLT